MQKLQQNLKLDVVHFVWEGVRTETTKEHKDAITNEAHEQQGLETALSGDIVIYVD